MVNPPDLRAWAWQDPGGLWWITTEDATTTGPYLDDVQAGRALHTMPTTAPLLQCALQTRRPASGQPGKACAMDPDEALRLAIAGLDGDDDYAAITGLTDYSLWVSRGGFPAGSDLVDQLDTTATGWADRWDFAWDQPETGDQ